MYVVCLSFLHSGWTMPSNGDDEEESSNYFHGLFEPTTEPFRALHEMHETHRVESFRKTRTFRLEFYGLMRSLSIANFSSSR